MVNADSMVSDGKSAKIRAGFSMLDVAGIVSNCFGLAGWAVFCFTAPVRAKADWHLVPLHIDKPHMYGLTDTCDLAMEVAALKVFEISCFAGQVSRQDQGDGANGILACWHVMACLSACPSPLHAIQRCPHGMICRAVQWLCCG